MKTYKIQLVIGLLFLIPFITEAATVTIYGKGGTTVVHGDGTTTVTVCPEQSSSKCATVEVSIDEIKLLSYPPGIGIDESTTIEVLSIDILKDDNGNLVGSNFKLLLKD